MNVADFIGSSIQPTKRWLGGTTEISASQIGQTPAENMRVDPFLPAQFADPYDPAGGIAIPAGRFVAHGYSEPLAGNNYDVAGAVDSTTSLYRMAQADRGLTVLTLHDGRLTTPAGLSVNNIFRSTAQQTSGNGVTGGQYYSTGDTFSTDSGMSASDVKYRRGFFAATPFVLQINNAHGTLASGDMVTGYWGSTTSTSNIGWIHRGKPVKWMPKSLQFQSFVATGAVTLTTAIYPGIAPRVVAVMIAGSPVAGTTTLAYNGTNWVATLPGNATQVWYEYGQGGDQLAGEVVRIQSLLDIKSKEELFKFVEIARSDYLNFPPPITQRQATVLRTQESANAVVAGSIYKVQNAPISVLHNVQIDVQGTVVDPQTGIATTYSSSNWFTLPNGPSLAITAGLFGQYHSINWKTGVIELAANITATAVRVTYNSLTNGRTGAVLWGQGIEGLTDGRYNNAAIGSASGLMPAANQGSGVPAYLNFADVVGEMRFLVKN